MNTTRPSRIGSFFVLFALSLCGPAAAADYLATGKYTGDGAGFRTISVGFAPDVVMIKGTNGKPTFCTTSTMVSGHSKRLDLPYPVLSNRILSLDLGGFTIGSDVDVNQNGHEYFWMAFKKTTGLLSVGTYTGNSTDNRDITSPGFEPDYVIVLSEGASFPYQFSSAMPAGMSGAFYSMPLMTDRIQAFGAEGFQVGTSSDVNSVGTSYHYIAWKAAAETMSVGAYSGNSLDNRSVTGVGFEPGYLIIRPLASWTSTVHRSSAVEGDVTLFFRSLANISNGIQAFESDGFQIGNDASVNGSGSMYYWAAFAGAGNNSPQGVKILKWLETR